MKTARIAESGRPVSLGRGLSGRQLRCLSGLVWVTIGGDARDHVLWPGQELEIESWELVVLQALRTATFTLD